MIKIRKLTRNLPYAKALYSFLATCKIIGANRKHGQDFNFPLFMLKSFRYHLSKKRIFAHHQTQILDPGKISIDGTLYIGTTYRGFLGQKKATQILNFGELFIIGAVSIGLGSRIEIAKDAYCKLEGCSINAESDFFILHGLEIGQGSTISWGCQFLDENFHVIEYEGQKTKSKKIIIGQHVWVGSNVKILPGVEIGDNSVVATNSVVTRPFLETNVLIAGFPAKIIRTNINWH
jgi:acetyltransferase-like isoleucine patch superfamily enzyme